MTARLLLALPDGTVVEHPRLLAAVRSGDDVLLPSDGERPIALPEGGSLSSLPGQRPVGVDPDSGELVVLDEVRVGRRMVTPDAVAAVLPPGYTRTFLPIGKRTSGAPELPQWAYTAACWDGKGFAAFALHTDRRTHWSPAIHSTADLQGRVADRLSSASADEKRLVEQLATCALEYRCFTAQHVFYQRDEGAIPASTVCNARCVGCISDQPEDGVPASHARMGGAPAAEEMAALGLRHLEHASETAPGRAMISFGQGCEGEPLTRANVIERAIRLIRAGTSRGSININTNASLPDSLAKLAEAGLDAVRVSLNSAHPELYAAYYKPVKYTFEDVRQSLRVARDAGLYIALNLLTFPGVTDREGEVELLCGLIEEFGVHQVQTRNLALDPEHYLAVARNTGAGGEAIGIREMIRRMRGVSPHLVVGNYARGLDERPGWTRPARETSRRAMPVVG